MEKPKQPIKSWPEPSPLLQEERWQDSIEIESWMNATGDVDDFIPVAIPKRERPPGIPAAFPCKRGPFSNGDPPFCTVIFGYKSSLIEAAISSFSYSLISAWVPRLPKPSASIRSYSRSTSFRMGSSNPTSSASSVAIFISLM